MRIEAILAVASALALALTGCAIAVRSAPPPVAAASISWPDLADPGGDRCANFRAYHRDCRRRHHGSADNVEAKGKGKDDTPATSSSAG